MAENVAYDSGIGVNHAPANDTGGNTGDSHLLTAFLSGFTGSVKDQISSILRTPPAEVRANIDQSAQLAAKETAALANSFKRMMASMTVADLEASAGYQRFKNRMQVVTPSIAAAVYQGDRFNPNQPVIRTDNLAAAQTDQPVTTTANSQDILPKIQERLKKAGEIMAAGDIEAGKAAFRQAIDMADKNYNATKTVDEIRQLQNMLTTNTFNGKTLTQEERMAVHSEILNRFAAAALPFQLRSGSILKDQAGYATVLRQYEQNEAAEVAYKDAIQKADAIPVAEMRQQIKLIAEEMGKTNNPEYINFLTGFSQNLLGGKDAEGNEVPGAIKLPITARKDLLEFYIRPTMQQDGTAMMSTGTAKDGTPRFVPDTNTVFKPEKALLVADEVTAKYKQILNIDLAKDPSKDAELQVFRATIDANLPEALRARREEKSYGWDSSWSNIAAAGVGLFGTAILGKFGLGRVAAKAMPSLFKAGAAGGELTVLGKTAEFATSGALASVTRNQMMTNYFDRKDETLTMSFANGFASTIGAKAFFQAPKLLGDKVFLRGFTAEAATARATKMVGPDGIAQLAKLKELQPGLVVPKGVTTFEQWAAGVSTSERATAIAAMAKKLEPASTFAKFNPVSKGYAILGQPITSAETLTAGGITARRAWAGVLATGGVTTFTDAADSYSRLWPKMLNGEATDALENKIEPTFHNMVVLPFYKEVGDSSILGGAIVGGLFGKPGALFLKPWAVSATNRTSMVGKALETVWTPFKSGSRFVYGGFSGATPEYFLRLASPKGSDIGLILSNNLQIQSAQILKNLNDRTLVSIYDLQLQLNEEQLKDRQFTKQH